MKTIMSKMPHHQSQHRRKRMKRTVSKRIKREGCAAGDAEAADYGIYDDTVAEWYYCDDNNETQGPYDGQTMASWESDGYLVGRVVSCWRFGDGMWIDAKEATQYYLAPAAVDQPNATAAELKKDDDDGNNAKQSKLSSGESRKASTVDDVKPKSKRLLELLGQLGLPEDATMESVAELAVHLKADLKAAETRINVLEVAQSKKTRESVPSGKLTVASTGDKG